MQREARRPIIVVAYKSLVRLLDKKGFVIEKPLGSGHHPFPSSRVGCFRGLTRNTATIL